MLHELAVLVLGGSLLVLGVACERGPDGTGNGDEPGATEPGERLTPTPTRAPTPASTPTSTGAAEPVEVVDQAVVEGLSVPWEIVWAGDETYVTERDAGNLLSVDLDGGETEVVDVFNVDPAGEGGLLGLAAHPDDDSLYAYYSSAEHGDNRVVRFAPGAAEDAEVIVDGIPHASIHNGGRIAFGPDGHLYIGTGDAGQGARSQDETSLAGAILRVAEDGQVPDDNPFGNEVYATGLRNAQGMAWTADGDLVAAELGPDRDDEVNVIEPGRNYGWPEVTGVAGVEGFTDPVFVAQPPVASWSGLEVLVDSAIPQWEGDALVVALRGSRLWHLELDEDADVVGTHERLVEAYGRLRQVAQGPDGALYLLTSNRDGRGAPQDADDRIVRLGPPR